MLSLCGATFIACLILFIIYKRSPIYIETPRETSTNRTQEEPSLQIRVYNDVPLSPMILRIDPHAPKSDNPDVTNSTKPNTSDSTTLATAKNAEQADSNNQKKSLKIIELEEDHDFN